MRYLPHTKEDIDAMLATVGVGNLDDLFATIPKDCCCRLDMDLPEAMTESLPWAALTEPPEIGASR